MSSAVKSVSESRLVTRSPLAFDLLFGILPLLLLAPLLAMEFHSLWLRQAMSFFPVPIAIVACSAIESAYPSAIGSWTIFGWGRHLRSCGLEVLSVTRTLQLCVCVYGLGKREIR